MKSEFKKEAYSSALYKCKYCTFYTNDYWEFNDHVCESEEME